MGFVVRVAQFGGDELRGTRDCASRTRAGILVWCRIVREVLLMSAPVKDDELSVFHEA